MWQRCPKLYKFAMCHSLGIAFDSLPSMGPGVQGYTFAGERSRLETISSWRLRELLQYYFWRHWSCNACIFEIILTIMNWSICKFYTDAMNNTKFQRTRSVIGEGGHRAQARGHCALRHSRHPLKIHRNHGKSDEPQWTPKEHHSNLFEIHGYPWQPNRPSQKTI